MVTKKDEEKKRMKQYIVDAFTDQVFHGNSAAICILEQWPSEELMMNMTIENNFSETAFAVKEGESYHLRWFTPGGEIDLCGHATLACAYVILRFYEEGAGRVVFQTLSGELTVERQGELYEMDFPAYELKSVPVTQQMALCLVKRIWGVIFYVYLTMREQLNPLIPIKRKSMPLTAFYFM